MSFCFDRLSTLLGELPRAAGAAAELAGVGPGVLAALVRVINCESTQRSSFTESAGPIRGHLASIPTGARHVFGIEADPITMATCFWSSYPDSGQFEGRLRDLSDDPEMKRRLPSHSGGTDWWNERAGSKLRSLIYESSFPTVDAFARKVGVSAKAVQAWLSGAAQPRRQTLQDVCSVLQVALEVFATSARDQPETTVQTVTPTSTRAVLLPRETSDQVAAAVGLLKSIEPSKNFCWAIISGPSSAGKDVLSYMAVQQLQEEHGLAFLTKITTRPRRPSEPDYVKQVEVAEFDERSRTGDIMFPFRKRGFLYGFDGLQFKEAVQDGSPLLSVFTEFRLVPALVEAMCARGIRTKAFLIQTEKPDVLRRVLFRNLPAEEVKSRIASIEQDYHTMEHRTSLSEEYTIVPNGDTVAFRSAWELLVASIRTLIERTG